MDKKIALVTGAVGGIGESISSSLSAYGYTVCMNYSSDRSEAKVGKIIEKIKKDGGEAYPFRADVSDSGSVDDMVKKIVDKFGRIDVLVNNAGVTRDGLVMRMSDEDFSKVLDINLKGAFYTARAVSRHMMKQRSGCIINISSIVGLRGNAGQANYSASKAGLIGLTKSLAKELAPRNIRVNAVAPGAVETDMFNKLSDEIKNAIIESIPLKRAARAEEIAQTVCFLVKSEYITGQVIQIDGGMGI